MSRILFDIMRCAPWCCVGPLMQTKNERWHYIKKKFNWNKAIIYISFELQSLLSNATTSNAQQFIEQTTKYIKCESKKKRNKLIKQSHTASQIELSKFSGCERFLFSHVRKMVGWLIHLIWPRGVVAEDRRNQVSNACKLLWTLY